MLARCNNARQSRKIFYLHDSRIKDDLEIDLEIDKKESLQICIHLFTLCFLFVVFHCVLWVLLGSYNTKTHG